MHSPALIKISFVGNRTNLDLGTIGAVQLQYRIFNLITAIFLWESLIFIRNTII